MSSKVYRLLRNNKEQGPYASEELIQKGLKPYDLIWVDGRSAAWSYPGEMPEFKAYIPEPAQLMDQVFKRQQASSQVSASVQAAVVVNDTIQSRPKPRYKVSAAWSRIQTITTPIFREAMVAPSAGSPSGSADAKASATTKARPLSWEDAWLDWEKEKSTASSPGKQAALQPLQPVIQPSTPVLETKYAESLDSIKDKYIENVLLKKKKSTGFSLGKASEFVLPSIALVVILSIGYWLVHTGKTKSALASAPVSTVQSAPVSAKEVKSMPEEIKAAVEDNAENTKPINEEPIVQQEDVPAEPRPIVAADNQVSQKKNYAQTTKLTSSVSKQVTAKKTSGLKSSQTASNNSGKTQQKNSKAASDHFNQAVVNNIPENNSQNDVSAKNATDLTAAESRRRTDGQSTLNNQSSNDNSQLAKNNQPAVKKRSFAQASTSYVNVPSYIAMNNGSGSVKIENISNVDLDLVVVDVQYYDAASRFRKGETLYLHNLRAGKSIVVKTPRDMNSLYAISKVSLVSSDAKGVYIVGDN